METDRAWADAYLAQALADFEGAKAVAQGGVAPSVLAMLLQMVFEKLGKAALLRSGAVSLLWAQSSHEAASRFLLVLRRERWRLDPIGGTKTWEDVLWVVDSLERAHPSVAVGAAPQLEYPWEIPPGEVMWPARDLPIAASPGNPASNLAARVLRFCALLCERFDQICP